MDLQLQATTVDLISISEIYLKLPYAIYAETNIVLGRLKTPWIHFFTASQYPLITNWFPFFKWVAGSSSKTIAFKRRGPPAPQKNSLGLLGLAWRLPSFEQSFFCPHFHFWPHMGIVEIRFFDLNHPYLRLQCRRSLRTSARFDRQAETDENIGNKAKTKIYG